MSTPIPGWAAKAAMAVLDVMQGSFGELDRLCNADIIAEALMDIQEAADERAAKIAEQGGCWVAESDGGGGKGASKGVWRGLTGPEIASAIRDRSKA